jgi:hypothetical protein
MFRPGDKAIHFTKYGGVNRIEVKSFGKKYEYDLSNGVVYEIPYIETTKNVALYLNGDDGKIFKIKKELTSEQCEDMTKGLEKLSKHKQERILELREKFEDPNWVKKLREKR